MTRTGDAAHNLRISNEMTVKNALQHSLDTCVSLPSPTVMKRVAFCGHNPVSTSGVNYPTLSQHYGTDVPVRAIKTCKRTGNIAPIILILGGVSRRVVRFTVWSLHSRGTNPRYPVTGRLWILDVLEYKLLPPAGFERDRPASNIVYIPTTISPVAQFVCFIALPSAANVMRCTGR